MVMNAVDEAVLAGSMKLPTNVSPARSRSVSPGCAALIADWRFEYGQPLAHTLMVAAPTIAGNANAALAINTTRRTRKQSGTDDMKTKGDLLGID